MELEQVIKQFQRRHSLIADGIIGPATIREMNVPAADRLQQININMERLRWLPDDLGDRYIMVNLANYRLTAIEDDEVKLDMRVIVGKTKRSTPSFSSQMTHIVLNPKWYVPNKLARLDLLPKQQANPGYFERYNFRVFNFEDGNKTEINPDSVDWKALSGQYFPYLLVQDPGKRNALGQLKFILPNPWKIYLHDTPSKSLFNRSQRNFSAGCIRVEDPLALASFSLSKNSKQQPLLDIISSNENYSAELEQPLSVYAIYATVWLNGNEVMFSPDSYRRDQRMAEYL
jgi:murein L,D-transpeptidase YcbB/YkuD